MPRELLEDEYVVPGHGCAHVLCLGAGRWQDQNKSTFGAVREIMEANAPEARKTKLDSLWAIFIEIETVGGSSIKARFLKPGKTSHVTWLGGIKQSTTVVRH